MKKTDYILHLSREKDSSRFLESAFYVNGYSLSDIARLSLHVDGEVEKLVIEIPLRVVEIVADWADDMPLEKEDTDRINREIAKNYADRQKFR